MCGKPKSSGWDPGGCCPTCLAWKSSITACDQVNHGPDRDTALIRSFCEAPIPSTWETVRLGLPLDFTCPSNNSSSPTSCWFHFKGGQRLLVKTCVASIQTNLGLGAADKHATPFFTCSSRSGSATENETPRHAANAAERMLNMRRDSIIASFTPNQSAFLQAFWLVARTSTG